ncbi:putative quinol monooxygenase [Actinoplanes utahensis]|uniref:Antibiotic biosynthesis monooxygenase n=1 Tax=Actinoplanes utahensis TaxID=1869 RepID=A0A0A6UG57_ACTUT|nr:putative quinol monooxygenase [Actinoplanes utahensis]KHD74431.1 antibiotic biosynthesis monooxygenase [Actinoplanes utahensis]GIF34375.1 antibiotic biosynthesis monooxygenase [Actinoplanes utahensis]
MRFGYFGSMKAEPGHRDEVVRILLAAAAGVRDAGCHLYVVGVADDDDQTIWVTEVWDSKEHHDASLRLPETRAAIGRAMPLLTGEFTSREFTVLGGLGLPSGPG